MTALPRLSFPGTRRGRAPDETLRLIWPLRAEAGITRVGVVSGLDLCPIQTVMVVRPLSAGLSVTQGKGLSIESAKVSGMMEAIEHYHAESVSGEFRLASEAELGDSCVAGASLAGRSPAYTTHRRILWQRGRGLARGAPRWVPFDTVHLDLRIDGPGSTALFTPNSNGLASGNDRDEATVHALYEVIERDLLARFYDLTIVEQERRRLVNGSVYDPDCRKLLSALEAVGVAATLWDLSSTTTACFFCELLGERDSFRRIPAARGFGCHAESGIALSRAITEAVQSRLTIVAGSRDDMTPQSEEQRLVRDELTRQQWLARAAVPAQRLFRSVPSRTFDDFRSECEWLVAELTRSAAGEPVLVDLSKAGWPVAVVRVVAPGLRFEPTESGR